MTTGESSKSPWRPTRQLAIVLLGGFIIRLVLAPLFGGFGYDVSTFQSWAATLHSHPVADFYTHAEAADHLPGDLWIMKALVAIFALLGGEDFFGETFTWLLKVVPAVFDVAVAGLLFAILSHVRNTTTAVRAAIWYTLNPAVIFITAIWGQWDAVSLTMLLIGLYLILRSEWTWILSSPFFVWAVLIKPQLAVPGLIFVSLVLFSFWDRRSWKPADLRSFALAGVASLTLALGTALAILIPFSVRLLPGGSGGSTLQERLQEALDLYPQTTLGAANVWMIPIGSLERISDQTPRVIGLAPQQWGTIGMALFLAYVVGIMIVRFGPASRLVGASWAAASAIYVIFMIPTRVHERYLFPILVFALLLVALCGFERRLNRLYWAISVVFLINLLLVYGGFRGSFSAGIAEFFDRIVFTATSVVNMALLAIFLSIPWWLNRSRQLSIRGQAFEFEERVDGFKW